MEATFGLGRRKFPHHAHSVGISGTKSGHLRSFLLLLLFHFLLVSAHIFKTAQAKKKVKIPKEMRLGLFTYCSQDTQDASLRRISSGLGLAFQCAIASQKEIFLTPKHLYTSAIQVPQT